MAVFGRGGYRRGGKCPVFVSDESAGRRARVTVVDRRHGGTEARLCVSAATAAAAAAAGPVIYTSDISPPGSVVAN